jgi:transposase-like protein
MRSMKGAVSIMGEIRRQYSEEFKRNAVGLTRKTGGGAYNW